MRVPPLLAVLSLLAVTPGCPRPERTPAPDASTQSQAPAAPAVQPVPAADPAATPPPPVPSGEEEGSAGSAACQKDEDCAVTRALVSACCEGCEQRAVSQAELAEISKRQTRCNMQKAVCPEIPCAPPRFTHRAACEAGTCVLKRERTDLQ
jgi:hypothetical protein